MNGIERDILPFGADLLAECEPIYEELPGWAASTVGATRFGDLPAAAQAYLSRMEEVCGVPIDLISTGADRQQTIVRRHPFE
jgi:adenylosuccinate synthase